VPIPFDIVFGFAAGATLALAARRPIVRMHDPMRSRYFAVAALFGGAALTPSGLTFYAVAPDWSLMYLANPAHLPKLLMVPLLVLLSTASPVAGFLTSHRLMRLERPVFLTAMLATVGAMLLGILAIGGPRILVVAYYDAFHLGRETIPLFKSRLAIALPLASTAILALLMVSVVHVRRHVALAENLPDGDLAGRPSLSARLSMDTGDAIDPKASAAE
jgi:hypothetical protein